MRIDLGLVLRPVSGGVEELHAVINLNKPPPLSTDAYIVNDQMGFQTKS